jgi:basic membrane lipoprotein Med (substrate-binding protein (PBP1-ABC) superfamily)
MNKKSIVAGALVAALLLCGSGRSDEKAQAGKASAAAWFEMLKKLEGEWTGKASHGEGPAQDATVTYKVTAADSTVMETLFGGTDHEMITMYHLDGDALVLTHYCSLGNQPRLKAQATDNATKIAFKFLDGTNLDPAKDMHMHEAVIEFVADDHLQSAWTGYSGGKPAFTAKFDLRRKGAGKR